MPGGSRWVGVGKLPGYAHDVVLDGSVYSGVAVNFGDFGAMSTCSPKRKMSVSRPGGVDERNFWIWERNRPIWGKRVVICLWRGRLREEVSAGAADARA